MILGYVAYSPVRKVALSGVCSKAGAQGKATYYERRGIPDARITPVVAPDTFGQ